jgi:tol-pal system protein YbgF
VFDPAQQPEAPGAPRTLGSLSSNGLGSANEPQIGAPGGRDAGAPLDLSTLSGNQPVQPSIVAPEQAANNARAAATMASAPNVAPANAQPPRAAAPPQGRLATLPPSSSPQDEYDLAYGYVLRKDYALAEQAFRDFLKKHPNERLQPDAQYWLGESLYQRQRYRDAAESFLAVSTKHERAGKAPDSLLRLGQSLAALNQKEAACATLSEVGRKYPKASASVKRGVEQEIKRAKC